MSKYILKRILMMIPVLLGVAFLIFTINHLTPGDPVYFLLGMDVSPEQYAAKRAELGLDKPFFIQFFIYIKDIVTRFDFGTSFQTSRSVTTELMGRFPVTLRLGLSGILVAVLIGVPFGVISATKQYSISDRIVTMGSLVFASMPDFWYAIMMILLFALKLKWLPANGIDSWQSWILPIAAVALPPVAGFTRMTRSTMLETIRQDYIRTARAKGLTEGVIVMKHALKNALIPIMTIIGIQTGNVLAGAVVIEVIFSIPGMGSLMREAIAAKNYPVIMGGVLLVSICISIINLVVDILYAFMDPRIRAEYTITKIGRHKRKPTSQAVTGGGK